MKPFVGKRQQPAPRGMNFFTFRRVAKISSQDDYLRRLVSEGFIIRIHH